MLVERVKPEAVEWVPHDYQKNAIKFLLEHACAGLFLDPGLGKTSISLAAFKILKNKLMARGALVVAPLRVCYSVWPREVSKWEGFEHLKVVVLHGGQKEQALKEKADIYVINPEGLEWLFSNNRFKMLDVDTLIIDESSKFKHTNTRRYKTLRPVLHKFARRWILTGTPAPNGLLDLFGQIYILDMGRSFSPYITKFRQEFFTQTGFGGYTWVPKRGTEERIHELLRPLVLRLEASDYLNLPQLVIDFIEVELPPKARKIYDDLENIMMAELENAEIVTALSAAAASMKCRHVANGGIYRQLEVAPATTSEEWEHLHNEKTAALCDLVDELNGQPVLVAYEFRHDLDRIRRALPKAVYAADYSAKKFPEIEAAWNAGEIDVLVGQPQSVGHGLNLQGRNAEHVCWYSQIWDLEVYEQFIQRVLRQGNKALRVFVHHIVAKNTVDQAVIRALKGKAKVQNRLLSALKDYRQERGK